MSSPPISNHATLSTSPNRTTPLIVRFYQGDYSLRGQKLEQIWSYGEDALEYRHDYIQYLFPLPERSFANPDAPLIDRTTFEAFRSDETLREQLRKSFKTMLYFYGFELTTDAKTGDLQIARHKNWTRSMKNWVVPMDHNHLRISRMLRSLRVLGLESESRLLHKALRDVCAESKTISKRSAMYWDRSALRPLYLAPQDEVDTGKAPGFLYEFEGVRTGDTKGKGALEKGKKKFEGKKEEDGNKVKETKTNDMDHGADSEKSAGPGSAIENRKSPE